ncbi:MAG: asparagine--tRNA ligase [Candidatus Latescibacter sp.]|nr:asparagine--tRNA ligase [Candidatus Latescibacter sp.]
MIEYDLIRHIPIISEGPVRIMGWVTHIRSSGKLIFIEVRDGTGVIQCVIFKGDVAEQIFDMSKKLTLESSLIIDGIIRRDSRSKMGYEIGVTHIEPIQIPSEEFPISQKEHGIAFLLEKRHLWLRSSRQVAILRVRAAIIKAVRDFLDNQGFILFDTPIFTPAACEGTTTLFETRYFEENVYLTQSGQLYNEAGAMALGRVYSFGPTFRAEKSKTRRHLTEFWMVEPEAAFFDLDMDMDLAQNLVMHIVKTVLENNRAELEVLERDIGQLDKVSLPFPRISYDEAVKLLNENTIPTAWGDDFGGDEETVISRNFSSPVFIHRYPSASKAFYMKADPIRPEVALCCDMIAPEGYGEIIGGGQREDDYDRLLGKLHAHGLNVEPFEWYLDLRKFGTVPHAGFGMGIERTVAWICGLKHVRETIPFPRLMDRIRP